MYLLARVDIHLDFLNGTASYIPVVQNIFLNAIILLKRSAHVWRKLGFHFYFDEMSFESPKIDSQRVVFAEKKYGFVYKPWIDTDALPLTAVSDGCCH